jgi:F420-non-reducing hydrogenase small subunit
MRYAVLQLSGCAGCEVSLLNAGEALDFSNLSYMPLLVTADDIPEVDLLLVTGGIRNDEDLFKLRKVASRVKNLIAVGTCAISGGVAGLGDREEVRQLFLAKSHRSRVPAMLPKCRPIDREVEVDFYLPGCPPVPELYISLLREDITIKTNSIVCKECGRKKPKDIRPTKLCGFKGGEDDPDLCLVKQGRLCVGSSTRNGCGAPCPRAGYPCVGCRGPSNNLIEKEAGAWFEAIHRVVARMPDIPAEEIDKALKSPHLSLFLFQFSDYEGRDGSIRPRDKVI